MATLSTYPTDQITSVPPLFKSDITQSPCLRSQGGCTGPKEVIAAKDLELAGMSLIPIPSTAGPIGNLPRKVHLTYIRVDYHPGRDGNDLLSSCSYLTGQQE